MNKNCKHEINDRISWIENEKRLSKNTIASYHRDLQSFMSFLKRSLLSLKKIEFNNINF